MSVTPEWGPSQAPRSPPLKHTTGSIQQPWSAVWPKGSSQLLLSPMEHRHQPGRTFMKCNLVRAIRGFQPITTRITLRIIDEARPATSELYEAALVQSSCLLRNAFSVVTVEINL